MKPRHAGLLIAGAALAAALAMKMTQPEPISLAPAPASIPVGEGVTPASSVNVVPVIPTPVIPNPLKPSPIPARVAPAPAPVYLEPAIRKNKPILPAREVAPVIAKEIPPFLPPVPYDPPAPAQPEPQAAPLVKPESPPAPRQVILPAGITILVRLGDSLSSDRNVAGDAFKGSLAQPLAVDGLVIAERGSLVGGRVAGAQKALRAGGASTVELELTSFMTSDGQRVAISTEPWMKRGDSGYVDNALAALRGRAANVPAETVVRFRLTSRVTIRERPL